MSGVFIIKYHNLLSLQLLLELSALSLFSINALGAPVADEYLYYRNFVRHADGSLCQHLPPQVSITAFVGTSQDSILLENAPRWDGGEANIEGDGTFGIEFGNLDSSRVQSGRRITVRFTDLATGQQGVLTDTIPQIPWTRFPRTLQMSQVNLPLRPDSVRATLTESGNVQVHWRGNPNFQYELYRSDSTDTLADGRSRERFIRIGNEISGFSWIDSSHDADTSDQYIVYALDSTGTRSAHSRLGNFPTDILSAVPQPILPSRPDLIQMYNNCWLLGLENSHHGTPGSNFVDWYIDEAFDNRYFQWDICFSIAWAKYSQGALPNIHSLDNFYQHQHPDGAISGVIREWSGEDDQPEDSPWFTRNNLFSWAEWEYYQTTGDSSRFDRVIPILRDYAEWVRQNRRHPNGHYYWSGWSSGMDNSPRSVADQFYPPYSWVDYDANETLAANYLVRMAEVIGDSATAQGFQAFSDTMKRLVNQDMWSNTDHFYWDLDTDGSFLKTKTVASFWPLWAKIADSNQVNWLVNHLNDPTTFNRTHRVPSLSADAPEYDPNGGYWRGGVWAPTNHMIVEGLTANHRYELAREIVVNNLDNMSEVFQQTNTVWENYAPEGAFPGQPAQPDFVGWSAVGPIAELIENFIGINLNVPENKIRWNLLTAEEVGLRNLDFGDKVVQEIRAGSRESLDDPIDIYVNSNADFDLEVYDGGSTTVHHITPGTQNITVMIESEIPDQPQTFQLSQNYPNPFNNATNISFTLPENSKIQLDIYNVNGQLVKTLLNESLGSGNHTFHWDGNSVSSGIYFYRLSSENRTEIRKMILLK